MLRLSCVTEKMSGGLSGEAGQSGSLRRVAQQGATFARSRIIVERADTLPDTQPFKLLCTELQVH
jgi:hypothetical protein